MQNTGSLHGGIFIARNYGKEYRILTKPVMFLSFKLM
jgi:hypothetical protein